MPSSLSTPRLLHAAIQYLPSLHHIGEPETRQDFTASWFIAHMCVLYRRFISHFIVITVSGVTRGGAPYDTDPSDATDNCKTNEWLGEQRSMSHSTHIRDE